MNKDDVSVLIDVGIIRPVQFVGIEQEQYLQRLRAFVGTTRWSTEETDDCTSWLELYLHFRIQSGSAFLHQERPHRYYRYGRQGHQILQEVL